MTTRVLSVLALVLVLLTSIVVADPADRPADSPASRVTFEPGWLGVSLGDSPGAQPGTQPPEGVKVIGVIPGSPAQKSGLRKSDRILSIEGTPVATAKEAAAIISSFAPGSSVSLVVMTRKGEERIAMPSLGTRPSDASLMKMFDGWIGIESIELPPSLREHFGAPSEAGVMVSAVKSEGPAEIAGIQIGDVLFEIDGEPVRSVGSLGVLITAGGTDNRLEVRVMRDGAEIVLEPVVAVRPENPDRD